MSISTLVDRRLMCLRVGILLIYFITIKSAMQLFKLISVQKSMDTRSLSDLFEQERFRKHLSNGNYEKILVLWGTRPLFELLNWYQFIEYHEGASLIIKCLKDFTEEYYS